MDIHEFTVILYIMGVLQDQNRNFNLIFYQENFISMMIFNHKNFIYNKIFRKIVGSRLNNPFKGNSI